MDLRDPANNQMLSVFCTNDSFDAGPIVLPRSGTYTLTVQGCSPGNTGDYQFRLLDLETDATLYTPGTTLTADLPSLKTDVFRITGSPGQRLDYDALDNDFDSVNVRLTRPNDNVAIVNQNSDSDTNPFTASESGNFYLFVENSQSGTPNYSFRLNDLATVPVLTLDTVVTGSLNPGLEKVEFRFMGTAGQRLFFDNISFSPFTCPNWTLFGPTNQGIAGTCLEFDFEATLPSDGNYALVLAGNNGSGTNYHSFQVITPDTTVTPLTLGMTVSGSIAEPREQDVFTFTGTIGQRLYYDSLDNDFDAINEQLISPSGANVSGAANSDNDTSDFDIGALTLVESGTYRLILGGSGATVGGYSFRLFDFASKPLLTLDTTLMGSVSRTN